MMVSVLMITYGHEKYIRQAIESILMQECDFNYELIVANDCSPDKTDEIINEIIKSNSKGHLIKYINRSKNIGMQSNYIDAYYNCKGEYIATCEGDDYWTDPLKLQKQVDFLETNADYILHSGNALNINENTNFEAKVMIPEGCKFSFELSDFLACNNLITCTVMFRNLKFQFPKSFSKVSFGDWYLYVILMRMSGLKVYRSTELYSVYRTHLAGYMSNLSDINTCKAHILQILTINKFVGYNRLVHTAQHNVTKYSLNKFRLEIQEKLYIEAFKTFFTNFKYSNFKTPFRKYLSSLKEHFNGRLNNE